MLKVILGSILAFVFVVLITFVLNSVGLISYSFFGLWQANVERHIFEHSNTYVAGKAEDAAKYKFAYETAKTDADRNAAADVIRHEFSNVDLTTFHNPSLENWIDVVRNGGKP